jgi:hypothetical protein
MMATLKDAVYSAIQDAPELTAKEYAILIGAEQRVGSVHSALCDLRNAGYIESFTKENDTRLHFRITRAREVCAREYKARKSNGHATKTAVVIQTTVTIEYDGARYELPQEVIDAIRRMK